LEETTNSTATAEVPELTVNITIRGEYLPPPEIEFDDVVVEVFEEDEDVYVEKIDKSDNSYFEPVISKISVEAQIIVEPEPEVSASLSEGSVFGLLGDTGGITSIVIGAVLVMVAFMVLYKKYTRKKQREEAADALRQQATLQKGMSEAYLGSSLPGASMGDVRATLNQRISMTQHMSMLQSQTSTISTVDDNGGSSVRTIGASTRLSLMESGTGALFDDSDASLRSSNDSDTGPRSRESMEMSEKAEYAWRAQMGMQSTSSLLEVPASARYTSVGPTGRLEHGIIEESDREIELEEQEVREMEDITEMEALTSNSRNDLADDDSEFGDED